MEEDISSFPSLALELLDVTKLSSGFNQPCFFQWERLTNVAKGSHHGHLDGLLGAAV